MTNTKHLIHRSLDIGSGLILSIIIQLTIFPYYGIYIDVWAMFHLALIFTVVGITRSYLWSKYVFKYGESKWESFSFTCDFTDIVQYSHNIILK